MPFVGWSHTYPQASADDERGHDVSSGLDAVSDQGVGVAEESSEDLD
jgi:hypothetical protein